ncbi:MAG: hypothetical protein AABY22_06255 [Nanoarchaeota archaeon]
MVNFNKLVEIARALSSNHNVNLRCKHYCFILKNDKILSIGLNSHKSNPRNLRYPKFNEYGKNISSIRGTCAEHIAVIKLGYIDCSKFTFVVLRLDNNGNLAYSRPCGSCIGLLQKQIGFKKLFYSLNNGEFYQYKYISK